jgi:hypothetical protein
VRFERRWSSWLVSNSDNTDGKRNMSWTVTAWLNIISEITLSFSYRLLKTV